MEVSTKCYRQQSRNSKRWQCALDKRSPAPCPGADACRGGLGNRSAALPRSVPECRRQLQPPSRAYPVKGYDGERHQSRSENKRLIEPTTGAFDQENRYRHQNKVENGVQDHRRQQTEAQKNEAPDECRNHQLDQPRVRRKAGIVRVCGTEDDRLQHERQPDQQVAMTETAADQGGDRQRHRAKKAFLHESGLQCHADRSERGQRAAEDVGIGKRFRRLPPSKVAVGHKIKGGDQCQLDRDKEIATQRSAKDSRRRRGLPRP